MSEMNLREIIETVQNDYLASSKGAFKSNSTAGFIRSGVTSVVSQLHSVAPLKSLGSAGQGNWAAVPWIGIFDTDISVTATKGFYLVYLFSEDMERVYLSLCQGWTYFQQRFGSQAADKIKLISTYFQNRLPVNSTNITKISIKLVDAGSKHETRLPRGYELATILSVGYQKGKLPNNETMLNDLQNMIKLLESLKADLIMPEDVNLSIDNILSSINHSDKTMTYPQDLDSEDMNWLLENYSEYKLKKTSKPSRDSIPRVVKRDYVELSEHQHEIGLIGEKYVVTYEKQQLKELNLPSLANKVEHVSVTKGDGLGYDVLSFNADGTKKYIEVKTTSSSDPRQPFYLSSNELSFAKLASSQYFLYRVYDLPKKNDKKSPQLYIVKQPVSAHLVLKPINYLAEFE